MGGSNSLTTITSEVQGFKKYLYGFQGWKIRDGSNYFRIHCAATSLNVPELMESLEMSWMDRPQCWIREAPSNAIVPAPVGWFLRSSKSHCQNNDLECVLIQLTKTPSLGLTFARIKDGTYTKTKDKDKINPMATIIECDLKHRLRLIQALKTLYHPTQSLHPLGMNLQFIEDHSLQSIKSSAPAKALFSKSIAYQRAHFQLIKSIEVNCITEMDKCQSVQNARILVVII